jgi:glycerophosphoryl diester phosphodiesterase
MIRPRIAAGTAMLLSFNTELLWSARNVEPAVWIGEVSMFSPNPTFRGNGVGTTYRAMKSNPRYMKTARQHNLWVCPLDPMPEEHLEWYLEIDVDALLTDHPDVTHAALAKIGRR